MSALLHLLTYRSSSLDPMSKGQFADWFRRQLDRREWNMSDFARRSDISPSVVGRWARGERIPEPASCDVIADVFGVDVDTVLTLAGHRPTPHDDDAPEVSGLVALVRKVRMDEQREHQLRVILEGMLDWDRRHPADQSPSVSS